MCCYFSNRTLKLTSVQSLSELYHRFVKIQFKNATFQQDVVHTLITRWQQSVTYTSFGICGLQKQLAANLQSLHGIMVEARFTGRFGLTIVQILHCNKRKIVSVP